MIIRKGKYITFLGCSGYPYCKRTMELSDIKLYDLIIWISIL
ncbi:hypothetical protein [Thermoanaerobacterium thermosaccharolyticum]